MGRLRILNLNIFVRPHGIFSGRWIENGDHKDLRLALLLKKMKDYDLVLLQEMFEIGSRQRAFVKQAFEIGFKYHCGSVWPTLLDHHLVDGGLLILSRYPIVQRDQHLYTIASGFDSVSSKGVLYAKIQLSMDPQDAMHVFTTHTQAGDKLQEVTIRDHQLDEMVLFMAQKVASDPNLPILLGGDFNLDARHDLVHEPTSGEIVQSNLVSESQYYRNLMTKLRVAFNGNGSNASASCNGTGSSNCKGKSCPREFLDVMKKFDQNKLKKDFHTITNGNGHGHLCRFMDEDTLYDTGKCIDYLFFSASPQASREDEGLHFEIHDPRTSVDFCETSSLVDSDCGMGNSVNGLREEEKLPITHLSDHYGLTAELVFQRLKNGQPMEEIEEDAAFKQLVAQFPWQLYGQQAPTLWRIKFWLVVAGLGGAFGGMGMTLWHCLPVGK